MVSIPDHTNNAALGEAVGFILEKATGLEVGTPITKHTRHKIHKLIGGKADKLLPPDKGLFSKVAPNVTPEVQEKVFAEILTTKKKIFDLLKLKEPRKESVDVGGAIGVKTLADLVSDPASKEAQALAFVIKKFGLKGNAELINALTLLTVDDVKKIGSLEKARALYTSITQNDENLGIGESLRYQQDLIDDANKQLVGPPPAKKKAPLQKAIADANIEKMKLNKKKLPIERDLRLLEKHLRDAGMVAPGTTPNYTDIAENLEKHDVMADIVASVPAGGEIVTVCGTAKNVTDWITAEDSGKELAELKTKAQNSGVSKPSAKAILNGMVKGQYKGLLGIQTAEQNQQFEAYINDFLTGENAGGHGDEGHAGGHAAGGGAAHADPAHADGGHDSHGGHGDSHAPKGFFARTWKFWTEERYNNPFRGSSGGDSHGGGHH